MDHKSNFDKFIEGRLDVRSHGFDSLLHQPPSRDANQSLPNIWPAPKITEKFFSKR